MSSASGTSSFGRRALRYVLRHVLVPETLEVDLGWRGITLYNFQVRHQSLLTSASGAPGPLLAHKRRHLLAAPSAEPATHPPSYAPDLAKERRV